MENEMVPTASQPGERGIISFSFRRIGVGRRLLELPPTGEYKSLLVRQQRPRDTSAEPAYALGISLPKSLWFLGRYGN